MILFGWRQGHPGTVRWIEQMETYSSVLELIVLAVIAATIWSVVRVVWNGAWGAILLFGVGVLGIVTPMVPLRAAARAGHGDHPRRRAPGAGRRLPAAHGGDPLLGGDLRWTRFGLG